VAILIDEKTKVLVQGITGREGSFQTKLMLEYGTKMLAGVTPGKGGSEIYGIPVYDSIDEALEDHPEINASIIFVPAKYASDAVYEALDNSIKLIVVITEHIPVHETIKFVNYSKITNSIIIGPNTPGIISPGKSKLGIMPAKYFKPGYVGIVSRSGTLTYEIARLISESGLGISTAVGIGGDPITGTSFWDMVKLFEKDKLTKVIVLIGEIGGTDEEILAEKVLKNKFSKPIVAYIAGKAAPKGKRMGHAGAIITGERGTYESKVKALSEAGIPIAKLPSEIPKLVKEVYREW